MAAQLAPVVPKWHAPCERAVVDIRLSRPGRVDEAVSTVRTPTHATKTGRRLDVGLMIAAEAGDRRRKLRFVYRAAFRRRRDTLRGHAIGRTASDAAAGTGGPRRQARDQYFPHTPLTTP